LAAIRAALCTSGGNAQHDLATGTLLGLFANLGADFDVVVDRRFKSRAKFLHRIAMKTDDIRDAQNMSDKDIVPVVKFKSGGLALLAHGVHGVTPIVGRKTRASSTWYFLAFLAECGR
jgi:hypothetical protein